MNLNRYLPLALLLALLVFQPVRNQTATRTLDIYFVDVEGGAATLIVTPAGESLLIASISFIATCARLTKTTHSQATSPTRKKRARGTSSSSPSSRAVSRTR